MSHRVRIPGSTDPGRYEHTQHPMHGRVTLIYYDSKNKDEFILLEGFLSEMEIIYFIIGLRRGLQMRRDP